MDAWCAWMIGPKTESKGSLENDWRANLKGPLLEHGFETAHRYDGTDEFKEHMYLMRYNNDQSVWTYQQVKIHD